MDTLRFGLVSVALVLAGRVAVLTQAPQQAAQDAAAIGVQKSDQYGAYLADAHGRALYLFMADKGKEGSACYDACANAWPPLISKAEPKSADPAVQSNLLGTIKRKDGAMQVTYNGWPLYYFVKDKGPGQTAGQDVKGFGAEWYLTSPKGEPVHGKMK